MADEVVTSVESALPPSTTVGQAVTSEVTPSTSEVAVVATGKPEKENWQNDPVYRQQQQERDRREAELKNQLQQILQQQETQKLASMSEPQRDKYLAGKYQQEAQALIEEKQAALEMEMRAKDIADLNAKHGVPVEVLETAATLKAAEKLADVWNRAVKEAAREYSDKVQRNAPDTGGGGGSKMTSQGDVLLAKAKQERDPLALLRAARGEA
jgi:murein L,D-transpeptidase YcbB/YkuD